MKQECSYRLFQAEYVSALRTARARAQNALKQAVAETDAHMMRAQEARMGILEQEITHADEVTPLSAGHKRSVAKFRSSVRNEPGVGWGWRDVAHAVDYARARTEYWQEEGVMV